MGACTSGETLNFPDTAPVSHPPCLRPTGLIGNIYLNNSPLKNFRIYSLDMKKSFFQRSVPAEGGVWAPRGRAERASGLGSAPASPLLSLSCEQTRALPRAQVGQCPPWRRGRFHGTTRCHSWAPWTSAFAMGCGVGPGSEKVPPPFLVFRSVHRFSSSTWNLVPETPVFPAFFLGALPVALSPLDTFMKLEVRSRPQPRFWSVLSCSEPKPGGGAAPHQASPSLTCAWTWTVWLWAAPSARAWPPRGGSEWAPSRGAALWDFSGPRFLCPGWEVRAVGTETGHPAWSSPGCHIGRSEAERGAQSASALLGCPFAGSAADSHSLCSKGWEKGVVFINGQNLGRYWNIGPQETLYLPGAWLDQGINQVGALAAPPLLPRPFPTPVPLVSPCSPGREGGREALATVC